MLERISVENDLGYPDRQQVDHEQVVWSSGEKGQWYPGKLLREKEQSFS